MTTKKNTVRPAVVPLSDRVIIKPDADTGEQKLASGIIIPDSKDQATHRGEVVGVGPGKMEDGVRVPLQVKVGDRVLLGQYGHDEVKIDGETYLIALESSILAII